ncbi:MAG TPA: phosphatase PAP2 family protein, partial [Thermoplasmatales archaeon]|nr:phosphatase PAP2 family protein [Thermoplasmatales archaeon]
MAALGVGNLILLISAVLIFLPRKRFREVLDYFVKYRFYLLLIFVIVALHLLEVNLVDGYTTSLVGRDFASLFESLEGDTVFWFSLHWSPVLLLFFVIIYLVVYPFTLWFSPLLFVFSGEKNALRSLAYGLVVIYILSLPFYLFFPVTNVYTHYNLSSALNNVIPSVENFFYATTTHNNCFPSLHVAMALLIAKSSSLTSNKRYRFFTLFCAILVIASVIYLSIHWLIDVLGGVIVFLVAAVVIDYVNSIESEVLRRVTP